MEKNNTDEKIIYKSFLESIEIQKFNIIKSSFKLNENTELLTGNLDIQFTTMETVINLNDKLLTVFHNSKINILNNEKKIDVFNLELTYQLSFIIKNIDNVKNLLENEILKKHFSQNQVLFLIYPYIRNYFNNCLSYAGLMPFDLPMIKPQ